jgi:PAS domain-containing protein
MVFVLSVASIVLSLFARKANHDAHQALETQAEFKRLGLQLMDASDFLTQQAQAYVQYGERKYLDAYWDEINTAKNRDKAIEGLIALGAPQNELDLVAKAGQLSNTLALLEAEAFEEIAAENFERARELMFGPQYDEGKIPIIKTMDEFQNVLNNRTRIEADSAKHSAEIFQKYSMISIILFAVFVIVGLMVIYNLVKKPLNNITMIINALSEGNTNVAVDKEAMKGENEIAHLNKQIVKLIQSLKKKEDFTTQIGCGNLTAEYIPQSEHDTLGNAMIAMQSNLIKADNEAQERKTEEEKRNWGTSGLAKFAEILRKDNDKMEALSYNVISNMVKYLGANQGGIFVWNDENSVLEMKACYAFDRKKFVKKQIHPGEGLVGTCYLEGEPIFMTDIPDSYITITSGLGDANPRAMFICPLNVNDRIYGVMELASFKEFEPYQLDFIRKVSESIAATISTVQVNVRTERLLTQSKMQAEEMANQEEELRQNMEEMQSTQEEMRRRESELSELLEANKEQMVKMNMVLDVSKIGLWDLKIVKGDPVDPNNTFIWSDDFRKIVGYSDETDFPNVLSSWSDKLHPVDKERTLDHFKRHILDRTGQTPYDLEYRMLKKNGEYAHIHAFGSTFRDGEGYALHVAGAIKDITDNVEEKQRQAELQKSLQQSLSASDEKEFEMKLIQQLLFASLNVIEFTADGIITDVTENLAKLFNIEKSVVVGKPIVAFVGNEAYKQAMADLVQGKIFEEAHQVKAGETELAIRHTLLPISNKQGELMRVMMLGFPEK